MSDIKLPEFTAEELNRLAALATRGTTPTSNEYYEKCRKFVLDTVMNDAYDCKDLTDKQVSWLWGIKRDVNE